MVELQTCVLFKIAESGEKTRVGHPKAPRPRMLVCWRVLSGATKFAALDFFAAFFFGHSAPDAVGLL